MKMCYNGVPVGVWIDGKEIRGFYLPSGVIAETATLNNCNTQQTIHITEINKTIERSNMNYKIVEKEKNEEKINMFNFNPLETIQHFDLIKEGVNVLDEIRKEENILLKNFYEAEPTQTEVTNEEATLNVYSGNIHKFKENIWLKFKSMYNVLLVVGTLIGTMCVFLLIFYVLKLKKKAKRKTKMKKVINEANQSLTTRLDELFSEGVLR